MTNVVPFLSPIPGSPNKLENQTTISNSGLWFAAWLFTVGYAKLGLLAWPLRPRDLALLLARRACALKRGSGASQIKTAASALSVEYTRVLRVFVEFAAGKRRLHRG